MLISSYYLSDQAARRKNIVNLPLLCQLGIFSIERQWRSDRPAFGSGIFGFGRSGSLSKRFPGFEGKRLVSSKKIVVSKESIGIDKDLTLY